MRIKALRLLFYARNDEKKMGASQMCKFIFFLHLAIATTLDMNEPQRTQRTQS